MNESPTQNLDAELLLDDTHDNYMLFSVGWPPEGRRIHSPTLYIRIRNGKFWIEEDWTEEGIATHLVEAGVPKSDIVLAFHAPKMRPHTEFAVA